MARFEFAIDIAAPVEVVFDLWTDLDRMAEWVGGVTGVGAASGPIDQVGTRYVVSFGPMKSPTEVIAAERPRLFGTRFGNAILRGTTRTTFEPIDGGTRLTETFETEGLVSALTARLFGVGSYTGSFRGELKAFAALAEAEARRAGAAPTPR